MAARLIPVAERINVEARRMILARPVDNLSGLAALLSVWAAAAVGVPLRRASASTPQGNFRVFRMARQRWANQSNSGQVTAREDGYNSVRGA
jgi:hypothetical protein